MGYWALDIPGGGINADAKSEHQPFEGLVNIVPGIEPVMELVWGDSFADIVDGFIAREMNELKNKLNAEFIIRMGRDMYPVEFLSGLAFSLNGGQFDSENFRLDLAVVRKEFDRYAEIKQLRKAIADIANNMEATDGLYHSRDFPFFIEDLRKVTRTDDDDE